MIHFGFMHVSFFRLYIILIKSDMKAKLNTNKLKAQDHKLENNYFEVITLFFLIGFFNY